MTSDESARRQKRARGVSPNHLRARIPLLHARTNGSLHAIHALGRGNLPTAPRKPTRPKAPRPLPRLQST